MILKNTWSGLMTKSNNRIICAAIKTGNVIIPGIRHCDIGMGRLIEACNLTHIKPSEWTQGFIDRYGKFHDRYEAMIIARANDQFIHFGRNGGDETKLYSEGLY